MTEKLKSKNNAIIVGRKLEMTAPYDLETCVHKLEALGKEGIHARERVIVIISGGHDKMASFHIRRSVPRGEFRNVMTIDGVISANIEGTCEVRAEIPKQDQQIALEALFIIALIAIFGLISLANSPVLSSFFVVVGIILVPVYLFASYRKDQLNTTYMLELVCETLE